MARSEDKHAVDRDRMVTRQIAGRGVRDPRVLEAMGRVPRHLFVDEHQARSAYADGALPISEHQTISQPYIVALMCEGMSIQPQDRVLEIGTGTGYSAAVLSVLAAQVYTIERFDSLASSARDRLARLGYDNVEVRCGDGSLGWPENAPFDAIAVAAAAAEIPPALIDQLVDGGRLVIPVGPQTMGQDLLRIVKRGDELEQTSLCPVRFVPLVSSG